MISCKIATELISKSLDESLSFAEELKLKMHLFLCETCHLFSKQSWVLRKIVQRSKDVIENEPSGTVLPPDAKEKLKRILDEAIKDGQQDRES